MPDYNYSIFKLQIFNVILAIDLKEKNMREKIRIKSLTREILIVYRARSIGLINHSEGS